LTLWLGALRNLERKKKWEPLRPFFGASGALAGVAPALPGVAAAAGAADEAAAAAVGPFCDVTATPFAFCSAM